MGKKAAPEEYGAASRRLMRMPDSDAGHNGQRRSVLSVAGGG